MKVKDLIYELNKFDQELDICQHDSYNEFVKIKCIEYVLVNKASSVDDCDYIRKPRTITDGKEINIVVVS